MSDLAARWHRYWFSPAPLLDLAVCRILVIGFQLAILLFPHAFLTVPPYARFAVQVGLDASMWDPLPLFRMLTFFMGPDYRPTVPQLEMVYSVTIGLGFLAVAGFLGVVSLPAFVLGVLFMVTHSHSYKEYHHIETIPTMMMVALACSPSSRVLSVDAWLRRRRAAHEPRSVLEAESPFAGWPLKLLTWMFALIYLSAVFCKLGGSGLHWLNGYTLQFYMLQDATYWGSAVGIWLGQHHLVCWVMSWATLLFEATFFVVLLFPRLGWVYAVWGILVHVGIFSAMRAPFLTYLPVYSVLIPWRDWALRLRFSRPASVAARG
jgi:hypothetical protein